VRHRVLRSESQKIVFWDGMLNAQGGVVTYGSTSSSSSLGIIEMDGRCFAALYIAV
jgi:hypothetical protein